MAMQAPQPQKSLQKRILQEKNNHNALFTGHSSYFFNSK